MNLTTTVALCHSRLNVCAIKGGVGFSNIRDIWYCQFSLTTSLWFNHPPHRIRIAKRSKQLWLVSLLSFAFNSAQRLLLRLVQSPLDLLHCLLHERYIPAPPVTPSLSRTVTMSQLDPHNGSMGAKAKAIRATMTQTDNAAHNKKLREHLENLRYFGRFYCRPYIDAVAGLKRDRELRLYVGTTAPKKLVQLAEDTEWYTDKLAKQEAHSNEVNRNHTTIMALKTLLAEKAKERQHEKEIIASNDLNKIDQDIHWHKVDIDHLAAYIINNASNFVRLDRQEQSGLARLSVLLPLGRPPWHVKFDQADSDIKKEYAEWYDDVKKICVQCISENRNTSKSNITSRILSVGAEANRAL